MKSLFAYFLLWLPHVAWAAPRVTISNGTYEGIYLSEFQQEIFLGIPYAQDTGGPNRFRIPQSLNETWDEIRPAKQYGHACPDENLGSDGTYGMGEDCLSINIVRPAGIDESYRTPIMVWIHGGRYVQYGVSIRRGLGEHAPADMNPLLPTATKLGPLACLLTT